MSEINFADVNVDGMRKNAAQAANLLKKLANEKRLLILCFLSEGEASVSALNDKVALSQSALSQHLAILRQDRLVSTRRDGQTIYYRLTNSNALPLIQSLHQIYCT